MSKNLRGFRALGIIAFGALTISLVSACNGNGTFTVSDGSTSTGTVATSAGLTATPAPGAAGSGAGQRTTPAQPTPAVGGATADATTVPQCATRDLSAHLGDITWSPEPNNPHAAGRVPVIYTNVSGHPCYMEGFGGVDLHGPNDPNGPVDSLRRAEAPNPGATPVRLTLTPGGEANTTIVFTTWQQGDVGSMGSLDWVPTSVVVTPPNQTTSFTLPWFQGVSVLRQDTATHVGDYIFPVTGGPNPVHQ
jgi:hypothetical protein